MRLLISSRARALFMILLLASLTGCGGGQGLSTQEAAYKTLVSAQIAYDKTMTAAAEAYAQGRITDQQKARIIEYGKEFKRWYLVAADALILGSGDTGAIAKTTAALDILLNFAGPLLAKKGA